MERCSLLINLIIRILDKVVSRPQERLHEHPILINRVVVVHPEDGEEEEVAHQIRGVVVVVMGKHQVGAGRRILGTVAKLPHGTRRRARPTHIRMAVKRLPGTPPLAHPIRINKTVIKRLAGIRPHGLLMPMRTMKRQVGAITMMAVGRLALVGVQIILHGVARPLHDQLTRVTHGLVRRRQRRLQHRLLLRPQPRHIRVLQRLVLWDRVPFWIRPRRRGS